VNSRHAFKDVDLLDKILTLFQNVPPAVGGDRLLV
jgi:hypothetical protein